MKTFVTAALLSLGLGLAVTAARAADEAKKPTPQQTRMAECNKEAGEKKGDERKAFMKSCLSGQKAAAAAARTAQQEKMKTCNKDAAGKRGDERKKFMSECLQK